MAGSKSSKSAKDDKKPVVKIIARNKRAYHEFDILDKWEAGMISEEDVVTKSMDPLTISLKLEELRAAKAETQSQTRK